MSQIPDLTPTWTSASRALEFKSFAEEIQPIKEGKEKAAMVPPFSSLFLATVFKNKNLTQKISWNPGFLNLFQWDSKLSQ